MTICVTNCFHWVGFHLVNRLVENDYQVDGISNLSTKKEEELYLMLGRNSQFSLHSDVKGVKDREYTDTILINTNGPVPAHTLRTFSIGKDLGPPKSITLKSPLLFGEWMPMNEDGVYVCGQHVPFDSNRFRNDAIYIGEFVDCFMQMLHASILPDYISLTTNKDLSNEKKEALEKNLYLRKRSPLDEQVAVLINHYKKIKNYKM